jgi:hypothetical protein
MPSASIAYEMTVALRSSVMRSRRHEQLLAGDAAQNLF